MDLEKEIHGWMQEIYRNRKRIEEYLAFRNNTLYPANVTNR